MLGIEVDAALREDWCRWLAPDVQPFYVQSARPWTRLRSPTGTLTPELQHTYKAWRIDRSLELVWLDEATFSGLPRSERTALVRMQLKHGRGAVPSVHRWSDVLDPGTLRSQADGRRFVFWPSLAASNPGAVVSRVVRAAPDGEAPASLPSCHREVAPAVWNRCDAVLPDARRIAGSFPPSSGPNCFATVMAAAGVEGAEHECVLQAPFLAWLASACRPGGRDDDPGIVLVWRDADGEPVHAAVTIGEGWVLEKASAEWWTPRAVRRSRDVIRAARARGQRLERHRITG